MEINQKIFKANDIRGIYPKEINEKAVFLIATGLSKHFKTKVAIGYDARASSPSLYSELKRGLKQNKKLKIIDAGLITTPTMYYLVNSLKLDGGVMVTASHAPKEFNGMKVVREEAQMLSGEELFKITNGK